MPPKQAPKRTLDEFYKTFVINNISKSDLKTSTISNLYERPIKDKGSQNPHYTTAKPKSVYQADVLYMPTDSKTHEKYILVVVDIKTKITEAEPMTDRKASDVVAAFKAIFKRKVLPAPSMLMQTDPGAEFENKTTKEYFDSLGIGYRFGKAGRSRQQAVVEAKNKVIAKALFMRMTANELETGVKDTDWVEFLPALIKELNKVVKNKPAVKEPEEPVLRKETVLLEVGQNVRVQLDKPREVTGEKLSGHFRATDIRWDPQIKSITNVILSPGQPPMYQVSGDTKRAYTFNQLQTVDEGQEKKVQFTGGKYLIEKVVGMKKVRNKVQYKVRWKGFDESGDTWEPPETVLGVPNGKKHITDFEASQKKRT
jgi:hypothetical protein